MTEETSAAEETTEDQTATTADDQATDTADALNTGAADQEQQDQTEGEKSSASSEDDALETGATSSDADEGDDESSTTDSDVPENYADFDMPDGFQISDAFKEKMFPVFKELGLSQEGAQKLISAHVENVQAVQANAQSEGETLVKNWRSEIQTDKEFGGENYSVTKANANKAIEEFGSPELRKFIGEYGLASQPELVRMFARIGARLGEDRPTGGDRGSAGKLNTLDSLYPDDVPKS